MKLFQIIDDHERKVFYVLLGIFPILIVAGIGLLFGPADGIQAGLIIPTIYLSGFSYGKQLKSTIHQSVDRLPEVQVGEYVIKPLVFSIKLRPLNRHCTLQFKLYEKGKQGLSPVDMSEFLETHFDEPTTEFKNTEDIAIASKFPSRVDIEREPFYDPEGLRLRTKSFESAQLRRLAEQTMWKITEAVDEKSETEQKGLIE